MGFDEVFSLRKPRDLKAGLASGAKSVAKGVLAGESSSWGCEWEPRVALDGRRPVLQLPSSLLLWPPACQPKPVPWARLPCRHNRPGGSPCHWRTPGGLVWLRKGCRGRWARRPQGTVVSCAPSNRRHCCLVPNAE